MTSSASRSAREGRMVGRRRASIVFPAPGGPIMSRAWPPAAAISSARRATSCPITSARSLSAARPVAAAGGAGVRPGSPSRSAATRPARVADAPMRSAETSAASGTLGSGTSSVAGRSATESIRATGSTPRTGRSAPSSPSSPRASTGAVRAAGSWPVATRRPNAIGRSKAVPSLRMSAGARFTVTRRGGSWKPEFSRAAETRSRLSFTAPAGSPTMVHWGRPGATSTSTSTR